MVQLNSMSKEIANAQCNKTAPHDIMLGMNGFNDAYHDLNKKSSNGVAGTDVKKGKMINSDLDAASWQCLQEWEATLMQMCKECVNNCFRMRCYRAWLGCGNSANWNTKKRAPIS